MTINEYLGQAALAALSLSVVEATSVSAESVYGVTTSNALVTFDSQSPATVEDSLPVTGLLSGEQVVAIDFRVADNQLYGLGNSGRLFTINTSTGAVIQIGSSVALTGISFGFDFNPTVDRIRLVSDADENLRINPDTGAVAGTDSSLAYDISDTATGLNPTITGVAYSANSVGQGSTTLFAIDTNLNTLVRQGSPNATPVSPNTGTLFTLGSLGINPTDVAGFDIGEAKLGTALAAFTLSGETASKLYSIDLGGGRATLIGTIGSVVLNDIAISRAGTINFSQEAYSVNENAGNLDLTIRRDGGSANPTISGTPVAATVVVTSASSTAVAGADFTQVQSTISFAEGERSKTIQLPITEDTAVEGNEIFTVTLSSVTGGLRIGGSGTALVNILDNDVAGTTALNVLITSERTISKRDFIRKGLPVEVLCSADCTGDITLTISEGNARRYRLASTTLAERTFSQSADNNVRLNIAASRTIASRLRGRSGSLPATVTVAAKDASGSSVTKTVRVRIR